MITEEILVNKSLEGDLDAFEQLVLLYQDKVYALAYRYMGNEDDANDLAQEAFVRVYKNLSSFKGQSSFGTWIFRITSNICLDELRRRRRRINPLSLDEPINTYTGNEVAREFIDQSAAVDLIYEQKEFSEYIQKLLNKLKPDYKVVIVLRDIFDFNYKEIANILNCSVGTVKSRLSRARANLRKIMVERELLP